jgi:hypothetical protein
MMMFGILFIVCCNHKLFICLFIPRSLDERVVSSSSGSNTSSSKQVVSKVPPRVCLLLERGGRSSRLALRCLARRGEHNHRQGAVH